MRSNKTLQIRKLPTTKVKKYRVHTAANLFPMLNEVAMEALMADIEENGQKEPVLVADNVLIDGRNRLEACHRLGIKVRVKDLGKMSDKDIGQLVMSLNVNRRHLTSKEKADAALRFYEGQLGNTDRMTAEQVGTLFGISRRTITNARQNRDGKVNRKPAGKKPPSLTKTFADFARQLELVTEPGEKKLASEVLQQVRDWQAKLRKAAKNAA